jgi:hypothetical protein
VPKIFKFEFVWRLKIKGGLLSWQWNMESLPRTDKGRLVFCVWGPVHSGKWASWNLKMCISGSPWVGSNSPLEKNQNSQTSPLRTSYQHQANMHQHHASILHTEVIGAHPSKHSCDHPPSPKIKRRQSTNPYPAVAHCI